MNAAEFGRAVLEAKAETDAAFSELAERIAEDAEADRQFELAYNTAYLATSGTIPEREAQAVKASINERFNAKLAKDLKRSAERAVDYRVRCLSVLQSVAALTKAEAQISAWEPREVESA